MSDAPSHHRLALPSRKWLAETTVLAIGTGIIYSVSMQQDLWAEAGMSPVWVKPGFSVAALLLMGMSRWPAILVGTLAAMLIDAYGGSLPGAIGLQALALGSTIKAATDTVLAVLGAWIIKRACRGRAPLQRLRDVVVLALVLGVVMPGLATALNLPLMRAMSLVDPGRLADQVAIWWLSELMGAWVVAPLMLAWADPREVHVLHRRRVHAVGILVVLVVVGVLSFSPVTRGVISTGVIAALWLPIMAWAALALGQAGASMAAFVAMGLALGGTLVGGAPFEADRQSLELINVQLFVASMAITALCIGAVAGERRRFQQTLADHRDRLRRLALQLAQAEHRRQNALAEQLHDGLGQDLAIARLRLSEIAQRQVEDPQKALDQTMQLLDRAVQVTRGITFELAPPSLGSLGLPAALRSLGEVVESRDGIIFEYAQEGPDQRMPRELETMLYRSARELVTNVVKHARAKHVGIDLRLWPDRVGLIVWDDGRGIGDGPHPAHDSVEPGSFGLYSLRETIQSMGGQLSITPREPGTLVSIDLPRSAA